MINELKKIAVGIGLVGACGFGVFQCCVGYGATGGEMIGQVKKVEHKRPIICGDFDAADISLGVMRNGVGSMSSQDTWVQVEDPGDLALLQEAAKTGGLVKIRYDEQRASLCRPEIHVRHVEVVR